MGPGPRKPCAAYLTVRRTRSSPLPHLDFLPPRGPVLFLTEKKGCPKDKKRGNYNYMVRFQPGIYARVTCDILWEHKIFLKCLASVFQQKEADISMFLSKFVVLQQVLPIHFIISGQESSNGSQNMFKSSHRPLTTLSFKGDSVHSVRATATVSPGQQLMLTRLLTEGAQSEC